MQLSTKPTGWFHVGWSEVPAGLAMTVLRTPGGTNLKLVRDTGQPTPPSATRSITVRTGCTYLTFLVADVAATRDALVALGGTVLSDPSLAKVAAFVSDPDGNLVELFRAPRPSPEAG